jgi:hypothetical protein
MLFINKLKKASHFPTSAWKHSGVFPARNYCAIDDKFIASPRVDWSTDDVINWARQLRDVIEDDLDVLRKERINGEALLRISQQDLVNSGMKLGPASKIIAALNPDTSLEHWQQLLKALGNITPTKVEWKGDPAKDPNLQVLTLPNDLDWPTLESSHLFIRTRYDCYDRIWTAIEEAYLNRVRHQGPYVEFARALIQGNSGIGKTAFLNYALYRAVKQGYPVLFETKELRIFIHGDKVEYEDIVLMEKGLIHHRRDANVLVLHDHQPNSEPPILTNGAFVIAPVSPDMRNSKEFRKGKCLQFWMPLPTRQELQSMNSIEPQLTSDVLKSRVDLFGEITRICLASTVEEYEMYEIALTQRIQSFRFKEVSQMIRARVIPTTQEHGLSWWIIHLDTNESLKVPIIYWGSYQIFDQITTIVDDTALTELENYLADQLRARSPTIQLPTFEYQKWATYKLAQGMNLPLHYFRSDGSPEPSESSLSLSKSEVRRDYLYRISIENLKNQQEKLFSSSNPKAVLCDTATIDKDCSLILFQATIGSVHSLKLKYLEEFAAEAKKYGVEKMRLIYIVPEIEDFKIQRQDLELALEFATKESIDVKKKSIDIKIAIAVLKPQPTKTSDLPILKE